MKTITELYQEEAAKRKINTDEIVVDYNLCKLWAAYVLAGNIDNKFKYSKWNKKEDNYDFTTVDSNENALEVGVVYPGFEIEMKKNQEAVTKGTIIGKGATIAECNDMIRNSINIKCDCIDKRVNAGNKYKVCNLAICVAEIPFYDDMRTYEDLMSNVGLSCNVDNLYIISRDCIYCVNVENADTKLVYIAK